MILYNVSVIIEDSAHSTVYQWLVTTLKNNAYQAKLLKMLDNPHEGTTYCMQMIAEGEEQIAHFQRDILQRLQAYIHQHHAEKAFVFDSRMQYISLDQA